jgi:DNA modification methylase
MTDRLGPYLLGPNDTPENGIYIGDARELTKAIPDESVDLVFTDPVYDRIDDYRWLAETAARVLREDRACLAWQGVKWLSDTMAAMGALHYHWTFSWYQSNRRGHAGFGYPLWTPLLWYERGRSQTRYPVQDIRAVAFSGNGRHKWQKQLGLIAYWLDAFVDVEAITCDPFTGGGTVPAVCKMLGRRYLAFEIDPATADLARERVCNTQPPLFVPEPEQLALEVMNP